MELDPELSPKEVLMLAALRTEDPPLFESLFPEQQAFVTDESMLLAALTDRRAGKTNALGAKLYYAANYFPNSIVPYIALTYWSAENILWPVIQEMNEAFDLRMHLKKSELTAELENGSRITLMGANTKDFMEKLRGPKYPMVGIDEAASFKMHLKPMVEEILLPAVSDYDGQVCLVGTPGPIPSGYFFDVTTKDLGFQVHRWSWRQNPYLPNQQKFVDKMMKLQGWSEQHPTYLREWCGQWVVDTSSLVYRFRREKNVYRHLPANQEWLRVLGIDLGFNDAAAWAVLCYSPYSPKVFIEHVESAPGLIPSQIAQRTEQLRTRFSPYKIVADTGGLGKSICEEMIQRWHLPIEAAEKREKLMNISLMNGDFVDGNIHLHESQTTLMDQYETLSKNEKGLEDESLPNDLCDASLYAYRACKAFLHSARPKPLDVNSERWAEKYWEKEAEKLQMDEHSEGEEG